MLEQLQRKRRTGRWRNEFLTDQYRIVSRLHEAPAVYDRKSGTYVAGLEADASLTYVTQLDGMILTEYVSSKLERYGILLDETCRCWQSCRMYAMCMVTRLYLTMETAVSVPAEFIPWKNWQLLAAGF